MLHPINKLCNVKATEPEIGYGTVLAEQCQNIWVIATLFPGYPIDIYDDDVSGAFLQLLFPPTVAKANVSIFDDKILALIALHFGGNFGPASWEAVANLQCFVTIWLFRNCHYQSELNGEALALLYPFHQPHAQQ